MAGKILCLDSPFRFCMGAIYFKFIFALSDFFGFQLEVGDAESAQSWPEGTRAPLLISINKLLTLHKVCPTSSNLDRNNHGEIFDIKSQAWFLTDPGAAISKGTRRMWPAAERFLCRVLEAGNDVYYLLANLEDNRTELSEPNRELPRSVLAETSRTLLPHPQLDDVCQI